MKITKEQYLAKIACAKSEIRVLILMTQAGVIKMHLEDIQDALQQMYDTVNNMPENQLELTIV